MAQELLHRPQKYEASPIENSRHVVTLTLPIFRQ